MWEFSLIPPSTSSTGVTLPMHFFFITSPKDTSNLFIFSPSPLPPSLSTLWLSLLGLLRQCLHWPPCSHSYTLIIYFLPRIYKDQLNPKIRSCSFLDCYDCRLPASLRWKPELLIIPRRTPSFLFASSSHNTHSLLHYIPIVLLSFLCLKQRVRELIDAFLLLFLPGMLIHALITYISFLFVPEISIQL